MKTNLTHILIITMAAGLLVACGGENEKQAKLDKLKKEHASISAEIATLEKEIAASDTTKKEVKAKDVSALVVAPRVFDHYIQTQGKIVSEESLMVSAKVAGAITHVYVTEGQNVTKGQVLAQIDNAGLLRGIEGMKVQLGLATAVFERQKNLWEQKIGTEVQYLSSKAAKEALEKQISSLEEQNEATRIKSPINGSIDELIVRVGQNVAPGAPAANIVSSSNLKISANISESYISNVKVGNKVIVSIPELKRDIIARVTFVGKTINPASRSFTIEIAVPTYEELRPNMTGTIKVVYYSENDAITVPVNTVQTLNGEKIIYLAEANGKSNVARKHVVEVVGVFDNLAHIKKGVKAGDKVITFGYQGLSDGQVIKL